MKKLNYILRFLNKKGALALGILLGLILALVCCISVHAESADIYAADDSYHLLYVAYMNQDTTNYQEIRGYSHFDDYLEHVACYYDSNGNFGCCYDRSSSAYSEAYRTDISKYTSDNMYGCGRNNLMHSYFSGMFDSIKLYIYQFSSPEECQAYFDGEIDASEALNYEEIKNLVHSEEYDSSIPYPDSVYFSTLGSDYVVANWDYNDNKDSFYSYTEDKTVYYDVVIRNFYCTSGFIQRFFDDEASAYNATSKLAANNIDEMGRLICEETVSEYDSNHVSGEILQTLLDQDGEPYSASDVMRVKNQTSTVPDKYSVSFTFNFQYVGSEISVTPYVIIDNVKYYGNTVVTRKFTANDLNSVIGSTQSVIGKDGNGEDFLVDQSKIDDDGSKWDNILTSDLDTVLKQGGVFNYISTGYGLSGTGGYMELSRRFFLGVPAYIWALIAMAMSVNIIVIVFKVIRGM